MSNSDSTKNWNSSAIHKSLRSLRKHWHKKQTNVSIHTDIKDSASYFDIHFKISEKEKLIQNNSALLTSLLIVATSRQHLRMEYSYDSRIMRELAITTLHDTWVNSHHNLLSSSWTHGCLRCIHLYHENLFFHCVIFFLSPSVNPVDIV